MRQANGEGSNMLKTNARGVEQHVKPKSVDYTMGYSKQTIVVLLAINLGSAISSIANIQFNKPNILFKAI